jgi:acyl-CoA thioester hydrolase
MMPDLGQAPFAAYSTRVREEWLDYNGHMNDAFYAVVFGQATEVFLDALGLGEEYHAATRCTTYTAESHIRYLKEAVGGEPLQVMTLLVDAGPKKIRLHHSLRDGSGDEIATGELLYLHVNQKSGRVEPMSPDRQALLSSVLATHARCARPAHLSL